MKIKIIKKIRVAAIMIMSFVLAGAVLTGCGQNRQAGQETQQSMSQENRQDSAEEKAEVEPGEKAEEETTEKPKETTEKPEKTAEVYEDNFAVDSAAAKEFAEKVKDAAARKDLEALAELTSFPVYVGLPDVNVAETKEDFLKLGAETVFTEKLLESIEMADIENFQPSMAGFSVSGGGTANINFGVVDGALAITGINY